MLTQFPILIDGGLSNILASQGCNLDHKLWTASILETDPEAIVKAHLSYLEAGARIIITSSYQSSTWGLKEAGYDSSEVVSLIKKTVMLAEEACNRFMKNNPESPKPLIAASIGPYGAYLADGSEYKGQYSISDEELILFHQERLTILDQSRADLLACETIPSFREARILADMLKKVRKKAWMSFSCKDGIHINDGTPIADCLPLFKDHPHVFAVGVNCTHPVHITNLIREILPHKGRLKIIVYPNSGEVYNSDTKSWSDSKIPYVFSQLVREWIHEGADMVGGCCQIGPDQIRSAAQILGN